MMSKFVMLKINKRVREVYITVLVIISRFAILQLKGQTYLEDRLCGMQVIGLMYLEDRVGEI